jgi:hypothetical protein
MLVLCLVIEPNSTFWPVPRKCLVDFMVIAYGRGVLRNCVIFVSGIHESD